MSDARTFAPFPRGALMAAAAVIAGSIVLAAVGRMTGAANSEPTAPMVASRALLFEDRPNGAVAVFDADHPVGARSPSSRPRPTVFCARRCEALPVSGCVRMPAAASHFV